LQKVRSLRKTLKPLKSDEIAAIASELNVKEDEVREMEYRLNGQEIAIDYTDDDNEDEQFRPISYLQDDGADPLEQLESSQDEVNASSNLKDALNQLDDRSRSIIESRWLKEDKTKTLHDLAEEFDISAERVRQIEQNALSKIKLLMSPKS
jgi:RNA polymerase sigma-32 factor